MHVTDVENYSTCIDKFEMTFFPSLTAVKTMQFNEIS